MFMLIEFAPPDRPNENAGRQGPHVAGDDLDIDAAVVKGDRPDPDVVKITVRPQDPLRLLEKPPVERSPVRNRSWPRITQGRVFTWSLFARRKSQLSSLGSAVSKMFSLRMTISPMMAPRPTRSSSDGSRPSSVFGERDPGTGPGWEPERLSGPACGSGETGIGSGAGSSELPTDGGAAVMGATIAPPLDGDGDEGQTACIQNTRQSKPARTT